MKNQLYKIELKPVNPLRRDFAYTTFKTLQSIRLITAEYVREHKKAKLSLGSSALSHAQNLRANFNRVINAPRTTLLITRMNTLGNNYTYEEMYAPGEINEGLQYIRHRIKDDRRIQKECYDSLKKKHPNNVLQRYLEKILSLYKHPSDNAEYVGIEIECITKRNVDMSALLPFGKWINVGSDGSINYEGDENGKEIRVCMKRTEVREVLPKIMQAIHTMGARVNKSCGLHIHLDHRNHVEPALSYMKLVRSLNLLYTVVPKSRRDNQYCRKNRGTDFSCARNGTRYLAVNATAFDRYKTLEVRLFGGTLEADKIMNWIEVLWGITEGKIVGRCPKNFDNARKYWNLSDENLIWLKARQEQFAILNASAPISESETEEVDDYQDEECDEREAA